MGNGFSESDFELYNCKFSKNEFHEESSLFLRVEYLRYSSVISVSIWDHSLFGESHKFI